MNQIDENLNNIVNYVLSKVSPEKIILFGSRARGDYIEESDYDILVIMKEVENERDVVGLLYKGFMKSNLVKNIDFLVISMEKYERLKEVIGYIFIEVEKEGLILYDSTI
jgi:predicted nucleotidyltransferase